MFHACNFRHGSLPVAGASSSSRFDNTSTAEGINEADVDLVSLEPGNHGQQQNVSSVGGALEQPTEEGQGCRCCIS